MCGIAGWISYSKAIKNEKKIKEKMLATMLHRGPDANGSYQEDSALLLHTRLAIMDPKNGAQPMQYEHYIISYNGELYNSEEVKDYLKKQGHHFTTNCDTEVVLKAFAQEKEHCVTRFNGIFAFAIWDTKEKRLFLARDRLGVKPLFYHWNKSELVFASEMKTLLAHPSITSDITKEGLAELFLLGPARTAGKTCFCDIKEIRQGEYAYYSKQNGLVIHSYFSLVAKEHRENQEQTIVHLKQLTTQCIQDQLCSDVGVCCFLSGGLDSSIIATIAAKQIPNLETFSIEYEGNDRYFKKSLFQPNRDADFIQIMVDHIHSRHTNVILSQEQIVNALKDATLARDLPGMAEIDSSLLLFCQRIKQAKSVALSGEGADEILGGYPWYYHDEILWKDEFPWSNSSEMRLSLLRKEITLDRYYVQRAYYETIKDVSFLPQDSAKEIRMREMFLLNLRWFLQTLLDRKDRMSMASALEVRVPFLDYRLVEYAYNMPWRYKSLNGREKGILREAFKDELPNTIIKRKKSPYPKTFHPLYTQLLSKQLKAVMEQENLLSSLLDKEKMNALIAHPECITMPWYGQLMKGPQILAYLLQMHYFFEHYHVKLK